MWKISVDMMVKAKKYSTAIKAFKKKYPNLVCYMESLEETLENMKIFYPNGLNCEEKDRSNGILYKPDEEYKEWNLQTYVIGIEFIDEDRIYVWVNSNEISLSCQNINI